jgi:AcrR family transcriptional regulator
LSRQDPQTPPEPRSRPIRQPRQERSQVRFEAILARAEQLFLEQGYEAVSMREIARATELPIASLYMYFPTKIAIVGELWRRYAEAVAARLEENLGRLVAAPGSVDVGALITDMIDLMADIQRRHPVYVEVWGAVAASPELRALNNADSLRVVATIATALRHLEPRLGKDEAEGLALVLSEAAHSATKLALELPPAAGRRMLRNLKQTMLLLYRGAMAEVARR